MPTVLHKISTEDGDLWMEVEVSEEDYKKGTFEESENSESGKIPVSNDFISSKWSSDKMDNSVFSILPIFKSIQKVLSQVSPTNYEIEAGFKFKTGINAFILSNGADVHFKIKLNWDLEKQNQNNNKKTDEA